MSTRLGSYLLHEAIGAGSFATVHRAIDPRLDDVVAIKVLAENHSLSPEIRERFIAEGRALRRVGGEHVAAVYDIGESERQQPYLVMEHADRGTLRERVAQLRARGWKASAADLLLLARALAAGVHDVHRAQLVHRDLSPGNLLLTSRRVAGTVDSATERSELVRPEERLLLVDLGMCKDLALNSGLTVGGGTSGFRPPEQEGPGLVDGRADIWAMSALLAWLAEGSEIPAGLTAVLERGMAESPDERPSDARRWLREVEGALAPPDPEPSPSANGPATPVPSSPVPSSPASPPPAPRRPRLRARWRLGLVTALAVIALAGGLVLGWRLGADPLPAAADGASISITGPTEVTVGEEAVFTAQVEGVDSWAWTLPTHRHLADDPRASVTATTPGTAEIVLRSTSPDGKDLQVTHTFQVVEK